jgi:hypothetical protein
LGTLKACLAPVLYGVPLLPANAMLSAAFAGEIPFVRGPALVIDPGAVATTPLTAALGGNRILRGLALAGAAAGGDAPRFDAATDDWLKFKRSELHPALTGLPPDAGGGRERRKGSVLAFRKYVLYLTGTGSFWLYWFILHGCPTMKIFFGNELLRRDLSILPQEAVTRDLEYCLLLNE